MTINEKEKQDLNEIEKIPLIPTPEGIRAMDKLGIKAAPSTPQITVNTSGNASTVSLAMNPVLPGTASIPLPVGTTAQRPSLRVGTMLDISDL